MIDEKPIRYDLQSLKNNVAKNKRKIEAFKAAIADLETENFEMQILIRTQEKQNGGSKS